MIHLASRPPVALPACTRGSISAADLAPRIWRRTGLAVADVHNVISALPAECKPMLALLQRLRERGHRLLYLSNMPAPYASLLEAEHAYAHDFEAGVFSSRVHLIKPEPAIFAHALNSFGIDAHHTLFTSMQCATTNDQLRTCRWSQISPTAEPPDQRAASPRTAWCAASTACSTTRCFQSSVSV